jgi:nickel-type superoxide dismutase maturation protease
VVHGGIGRALGGAWQVALWAAGRRRRYQVTGASMAPALAAGDWVLVDPGAYRRRPPRPGDVVVVRHPYRRDLRLVKRVGTVLPDGRCRLLGDNPGASTDSRAFGAVPPDLVEGPVVLHVAAGAPRGPGAPPPE